MAESGIVYSSKAKDSCLYVSWSVGDTDIANNKKRIDWTAGIIIAGGNLWYSNAVKINSIYIDGGASLGSGTYSNFTSNGTYAKLSGSKWVSHNDDGNKKITVSISGWFYSSYNVSGSSSFDLPTIPRASSITAATGYIGSPLTISISRHATSFTHTLKYAFGSASGQINMEPSATTVAWTPPIGLCSQIPKANDGVCKITCETYSGGKLIGSSQCEVKLNVPSSVGLTLSDGWATVAAYNTGTTAASMSGYIQGYSKAKVTFNTGHISTANSYGAGIKAYRVVFDGKEVASPYLTPTLQRPDTFSIICYVTDTRDRTQSTTLNFTVQPYSSPTMSGISCFRCDDKGNASDTGTYIYVKATAVYSTLGGANKVTLRARYKTSAGSYGSYTTLTSGKGEPIGEGYVLPTSTYVVEITATDSLGGASVYTGYIPSEDVFFHGRKGGNGAGFGMYSQHENGLDIDWDVYMNGHQIHDNKGFPRHISLPIQQTSHRRSVIALCNTAAINSHTGSFTNGIFTASRFNALNAPTSVMVYMADCYSLDHGVMVAMLGFSGEQTAVRPCTFTYGGVVYGGLEYYFQDAQSDVCKFTVLDSNFEIFALDYCDTQGTVINTEVYNSLNFTNYTAQSKMISYLKS